MPRRRAERCTARQGIRRNCHTGRRNCHPGSSALTLLSAKMESAGRSLHEPRAADSTRPSGPYSPDRKGQGLSPAFDQEPRETLPDWQERHYHTGSSALTLVSAKRESAGRSLHEARAADSTRPPGRTHLTARARVSAPPSTKNQRERTIQGSPPAAPGCDPGPTRPGASPESARSPPCAADASERYPPGTQRHACPRSTAPARPRIRE